MKRAILACVVTALVVGAGTATAAKLITSKDIKDGTIKSADIKNGGVQTKDIKKGTIKKDRLASKLQQKIDQPGPAGPAGAAGPAGPQGPAGAAGPRGCPGRAWSDALLRELGSHEPQHDRVSGAFLRSGPSTPEVGPIPAQAPPFGEGSLIWSCRDADSPDRGGGEAAYGNEVDFLGLSFDDLAEVGFHVYTTPENVSAGGTTPYAVDRDQVDPNLDAQAAGQLFDVTSARHTLPLRWSDYQTPLWTAWV